MKDGRTTKNRYPKGWDKARAQRVIAHYEGQSDGDADRIGALRLRLLELGVGTPQPAWSSWVLERLVDAATKAPDGRAGDVLLALNSVLAESKCPLTDVLGNLILDLVRTCFLRSGRDKRGAENLAAVIASPGYELTPAQAYLALLALPQEMTTAELAERILQGLKNTKFHSEAVASLTTQ